MARPPTFEEYCDTNDIRSVEQGPAFAAYVDLLSAQEWDHDASSPLLAPHEERATGVVSPVALAALVLGAAAVIMVAWLPFLSPFAAAAAVTLGVISEMSADRSHPGAWLGRIGAVLGLLCLGYLAFSAFT